MRGFLQLGFVALVAIGSSLSGCTRTQEAAGVAREFTAQTTAGGQFTGDSLRGRVTILDFWGVF